MKKEEFFSILGGIDEDILTPIAENRARENRKILTLKKGAEMKRIIAALAVLMTVSAFALTIVALDYKASSKTDADENGISKSEESYSGPETVIYEADGDPDSLRTLYYSKTIRIAGRDVYCYSEPGNSDLYLFDKNVSFIGWISDPDSDPTLGESFEKVIKDPGSGISDDEAVKIAYEHAAGIYGSSVLDCEIVDVAGDDYSVLVTLAKMYEAADFSVRGPGCAVRVMRDGTVDLCTGGMYDVDADALSKVTLAETDSFVRKKIDEQFGGAVERYEVFERRVVVNDAGLTAIRIGVSCFFKETPSKETVEKYGLGGTWGLDNRYGCSFEYVIG